MLSPPLLQGCVHPLDDHPRIHSLPDVLAVKRIDRRDSLVVRAHRDKPAALMRRRHGHQRGAILSTGDYRLYLGGRGALEGSEQVDAVDSPVPRKKRLDLIVRCRPKHLGEEDLRSTVPRHARCADRCVWARLINRFDDAPLHSPCDFRHLQPHLHHLRSFDSAWRVGRRPRFCAGAMQRACGSANDDLISLALPLTSSYGCRASTLGTSSGELISRES